jgi:beta-lactamase regulating signal transducer with metallopeptidase domain
MSATVIALATRVVDRLAAGSIQAVAVIAAAWLVCRLWKRMPAAAQAMVWWLVALKLVVGLVPLPAMSLPVLPAMFSARADDSSGVAEAVVAPLRTIASLAPETGVAPEGKPTSAAPPIGLLLIAAIWFAGVVAGVARLAVAYRRTRRIIAGAADTGVEHLEELAARLQVGAVPAIKRSTEIAVPQVVGAWRPTVLLPADPPLSDDDLRLAIAHELMHVRRHDVALGWIPAVAERIFFFHPLVGIAVREYLTAREAACDAAVIDALDLEPADYGRMLIRFGIAGATPVFAAGGASASASSLRRRLIMLQQASPRGSRWLVPVSCAVMVLSIAPFHLVARAAAAKSAAPVDVVPRAPHAATAPAAAAPALQQATPAPAPRPAREVQRMPPVTETTQAQMIEDLKRALSVAQAQLAAMKARNDEVVAKQRLSDAARQQVLARVTLAAADSNKALTGQIEVLRTQLEEVRQQQKDMSMELERRLMLLNQQLQQKSKAR